MQYTDYDKHLGALAKECYFKLFLGDFADAFSQISESKQFDVVIQIICCLDKRNVCFVPMTEIAQYAKVSYKTVQNTVNKMLEHDLARRISSGAFMLNPNLVCRGKPHVKQQLLEEYAALTKKEKLGLQEE
jgi:predicted transcriptional regulator